jgi:hypothetical protein
MTMASKPTKTEAALQLRDHAMAILRRHGQLNTPYNIKITH